MNKKALLLSADYFDATTSSRRVLSVAKTLFSEIEFLYWARSGEERINDEEIYSDIKKTAFTKTAKPRSLAVLFLSLNYQFWLLKKIKNYKPEFVVAFTFYTIFPALIYKYLLNNKCKVVYDPRDYVSTSYRVNGLISYSLNLLDNLFIKFSDLVVFPDNQYFIYYGKYKLKKEKYFILPNSSEDLYDEVKEIDIYEKYSLPRDKYIIPVLGYFSENRGEKVLFDLINKKHEKLHFVFAGDIRDLEYLSYFDKNQENVSFLNKVPYIDALAIIKESLIVPQLYDPELFNNVYAYPTKYYDCLMVGTPMVVSKGQIDVLSEIKENNLGFGIDYDDLDGLMNIIDELMNNKNLINKNKLRQFFLEKYDYNLYKSRLRDFYSQSI